MLLSFADKKAEKRSQQAISSDRPIRSLAKAISWRVTGSIDTILLSWFFTGNLTTAAAIGLTEVITKMVLYYLHERIWNRIGLGRSETDRWQRSEVLKEKPAVASGTNY
ncbi:MAG: DUF2061 domain-containing protein [gamma proteobacterium symbiont of Ctena orbiculata]|nr:DUF2061 domain-containing protein [Candidatus Thiodiazotropha taylori]MBT3058638.1 DUF2061 domain-containing protein [Candidatus Thiodiazotropha sp. (ex Lucina pensylvanica)]MBV2094382.1 DUF2061 domain-containing protein [Candidatus Thiodiazotropha sp. (ex Codakia orbicularis)]PUB72080.1 MAG: hypothetical protein DBP03_18610 [gamma proteobacterium symbiont of Ctena orbiculata]MBT3064022.1 DUF2061 domain-containing protein [Candidatus Thiodiazotropha sp. (ex Lucina pensylvanica)]